MGSKSVKIVIIVAVIIGVLAIIGITALVVFTTKSSEPRVVDLSEDVQNEEEELSTDNEEETVEEVEDESEEEAIVETGNTEETENQENSALQSFYNKLLKYEGDNVNGEKLNELLEIIRKNNEQNQNYQIKALANVENWDNDSNKAKSDSNYKISFEKNDEGIINAVKIEDAE